MSRGSHEVEETLERKERDYAIGLSVKVEE